MMWLPAFGFLSNIAKFAVFDDKRKKGGNINTLNDEIANLATFPGRGWGVFSLGNLIESDVGRG